MYQSSFQNEIKFNDPANPRPHWYLGRVICLIVREDGNIRSVKLRRGNGSDVLHSLKHLYPLELSNAHDNHPQQPIDDTVSNNDLSVSYSILPDLYDHDLDMGNSKNLTQLITLVQINFLKIVKK